MLSALAHAQQALRFQVMNQSDMVLATPETHIVDANHGDAVHFLLRARHTDVVLDPMPQLLRIDTQQGGGVRDRHGLAQRQGERFEQQRKTAARACPRHRHRRGLAASAAIGPRHVGVQP